VRNDTILNKLEQISRRLEEVGDNIERATSGWQLGSKGGHWGNADLMVLAAFRYCVGQRSYIVHDCVNWLIANWSEFEESTRAIIRRELEDMFSRDVGTYYRPLGDDCDRAEWERLRTMYLSLDDVMREIKELKSMMV